MTKTNNKMSKAKIAGVVGVVGAIAATTLGAYFFAKTPKGKKKIQKIKSGIEGWANLAKRDIVGHVKQLKNINQKVYDGIVEAVLKKYESIKEAAPKEIAVVARDLKKHWQYVKKDIQKLKNAATQQTKSVVANGASGAKKPNKSGKSSKPGTSAKSGK